MIDRARTEAVIYRTAVMAIYNYPGKPDEEPGYTVEEDITWCLEPLDGEGQDVVDLRAHVRRTILDPSKNREMLVHHLDSLAQ